ncbi:hypothetical protein [Brevundimonas sp.]|uniref:hypothetical protein n=1 Tax=Brevundimonas sp. TaxID=1871086 RepID=UPI0028AEBC49|nr:hypothetical protein [Brevundimonas sp.]
MTVATNRANSTNTGAFATSRRGGLTPQEVQMARGMRDRGRGWQTIANILGRCREDLQGLEASNDAGQLVGGLRLRPFAWTEETLAESERLYREGFGANTIATAVNCDLRTAEARYSLLRRKVKR